MSRSLPESDWKLFRELHPTALNRCCERVLADIARVAADPTTSPHQRYLKIYKLIERRDRTIGETFNDLRRSTAILSLLAICSQKLITANEIEQFTQDTRDCISNVATPRD